MKTRHAEIGFVLALLVIVLVPRLVRLSVCDSQHSYVSQFGPRAARSDLRAPLADDGAVLARIRAALVLARASSVGASADGGACRAEALEGVESRIPSALT